MRSDAVRKNPTSSLQAFLGKCFRTKADPIAALFRMTLAIVAAGCSNTSGVLPPLDRNAAAFTAVKKPTTITSVSRSAFFAALQRVQPGWSKTQVKETLGCPEDVWPEGDPSQYQAADQESWCYGTNGHHTLPTLGRVVFQQEVVSEVIGQSDYEPPASSLISEEELRTHMRAIFQGFGSRDESSPQHLIQASNDLFPLGKEKAVAVLLEYDRVLRDGYPSQDWLFWLTRVLFRSTSPGGFFDVPRLGAMTPTPPKNSWPTYPVITIDDVPVSLYRGAFLGGSPDRFSAYAKYNESTWQIRTTKLRPPDDPFPVVKKIVASPDYPFDRHPPLQPPGYAVPFLIDEGYVLQEILRMVKSAYRPAGVWDHEWDPSINGLDYDKYHRNFLRLGCRWDEAKQQYVRADGSVIQESASEYPQYKFDFKAGRMHGTIGFTRTDATLASYTAEVKASGGAVSPTAVMTVFDASTGKEIYRQSLTEGTMMAGFFISAKQTIWFQLSSGGKTSGARPTSCNCFSAAARSIMGWS